MFLCVADSCVREFFYKKELIITLEISKMLIVLPICIHDCRAGSEATNRAAGQSNLSLVAIYNTEF